MRVCKHETQRWYVAQTQPKKERLAREQLERQEFVSFLPMVKRLRKGAVGAQYASKPLFPGYIFVAFDLERERWRSINGTIGLRQLVSFGDQPAALPDGFTEALMRRTGKDENCPLEGHLEDGAPVRVVGGIFDDLTGTLLAARPQERVVVLLDLLSGPRKVQLQRSQLIRA